MTKKNYIAAAKMISLMTYDIHTTGERAAVVNAFVDFFESDNPRFDRARFLDACGIDSRMARAIGAQKCVK